MPALPGGHESHEFLLTHQQMQEVFAAQMLHQDHLGRTVERGHELDVLGARPNCSGPRRRAFDRQGVDGKKVNRRDAQSCCYVNVRRPLVDVLRRTDLDEAPLLEDPDAAGHSERLDLIVRHIEHGCTQIGLNMLQLDAQFRTQLRVER